MAFIYHISPSGTLFVVIVIASPTTSHVPISPGVSVTLCSIGEFFDTVAGGGNTTNARGGDWLSFQLITTANTADPDGYTGVRANMSGGSLSSGLGSTNISGIENIKGTIFKDQITGDGGDNSLDGYDGNDLISGGAGKDYLLGGEGDDTLRGDSGAAIVTGKQIGRAHV